MCPLGGLFINSTGFIAIVTPTLWDLISLSKICTGEESDWTRWEEFRRPKISSLYLTSNPLLKSRVSPTDYFHLYHRIRDPVVEVHVNLVHPVIEDVSSLVVNRVLCVGRRGWWDCNVDGHRFTLLMIPWLSPILQNTTNYDYADYPLEKFFFLCRNLCPRTSWARSLHGLLTESRLHVWHHPGGHLTK